MGEIDFIACLHKGCACIKNGDVRLIFRPARSILQFIEAAVGFGEDLVISEERYRRHQQHAAVNEAVRICKEAQVCQHNDTETKQE